VPRSRPDAPPPRPTRAQLLASAGRPIPDLIARDLDVLFCGINPGLYSAFTGLHFAKPGNRFWRALHDGGLTRTRLEPWQRQALLAARLGITNLVMRSTATAAELDNEELRAGRARLERKVRRYKPLVVAMVGIGAYRVAFDRPKAVMGPQPETIAGVPLWVLPNTSGLNANHRRRTSRSRSAHWQRRCGRGDGFQPERVGRWNPAGRKHAAASARAAPAAGKASNASRAAPDARFRQRPRRMCSTMRSRSAGA